MFNNTIFSVKVFWKEQNYWTARGLRNFLTLMNTCILVLHGIIYLVLLKFCCSLCFLFLSVCVTYVCARVCRCTHPCVQM